METITLNKKFELLPEYLKNEVNDFVDFLTLKKETKNNLNNFAGIFTEKEVERHQFEQDLKQSEEDIIKGNITSNEDIKSKYNVA